MSNYLGVATDDIQVNSLTFKNPPGDVVTSIYHVSKALTPAAVAANTTAEQTFSGVTGLAVGDVVWVTKPTAQAGLGIVNVRVSAANTLAITFSNNTAGSITPTAETYQIGGIR
jgi:hypothetical protein